MSQPSETITLCMIARDEEAMIGQALASVRDVVQQIIVVDTGSVDATREIAAGLGAEVLSFEWCDDFATARNVGLARATGDWILVLDADEAIAPEQLSLLPHLTAHKNNCYELTQRHYSNDHRLSGFEVVRGEHPTWERNYRGFFESSLVRLFPNHRKIEYIGRIHELVEPSIYTIPGLSIVRSPLLLHHYGHTPEVLQKKDKNKLYRSLGQTKSREMPRDWKAYFELGVECNRPEQREESIQAFRKSLELNPSYLPSWINLGYVLCELGRCTEAIEALGSALRLDPKSSEAHCNTGVAFLRLPNPAQAERHFREAIRLSPGYLNAYMNLSRALASQGRFPEAILVMERAQELAPQPAITAELGALYAAGGAREIGVSLLKSALQLDPELERAREVLRHLGER